MKAVLFGQICNNSMPPCKKLVIKIFFIPLYKLSIFCLICPEMLQKFLFSLFDVRNHIKFSPMNNALMFKTKDISYVTDCCRQRWSLDFSKQSPCWLWPVHWCLKQNTCYRLVQTALVLGLLQTTPSLTVAGLCLALPVSLTASSMAIDMAAYSHISDTTHIKVRLLISTLSSYIIGFPLSESLSVSVQISRSLLISHIVAGTDGETWHGQRVLVFGSGVRSPRLWLVASRRGWDSGLRSGVCATAVSCCHRRLEGA
jgi:hypothetical protein